LALFIGTFLLIDPMLRMGISTAPIETLTIEQVRVTERGFAIKVRSDSPEPILIAQTLVDGAYWVFTQEPPGPIARMGTARIHVDFPWVADEVHHLRLVTRNGTTFDHTIDIALQAPTLSWESLIDFALLGIFVGLIPVAFGMLFFPAIKSLRPQGLEFVLALTVGLLGYLFIDMAFEGLELSEDASDLFGGPALVLIPMALTLIALLWIGNRSGKSQGGLRVATFIALGIGLHNFGEGLAIGASIAANEAALGAFLVVGFALHNTTEGVGVVAPLVKERAALPIFVGLALLAGLPAVPGIWVGAFSFAPHWAAVFFGVGAGAVLQVIVEIDRFQKLNVRAKAGAPRFTGTSVAGYAAGAALMYGTALLIEI
jgi:zinc transporter, ZIP family